MFFTAKQFMTYTNSEAIRRRASMGDYRFLNSIRGGFQLGATNTPLTLKEARNIMRQVKRRMVARDVGYFDGRAGLTKWFRPWDVVPELKEFTPPEGDYGIGIEVELGFTSRANVQHIANIIKDWKYIALDEEGGSFPLEVTFPPLLYSKLSSKSQPMRYLKLLKENEARIYRHSPGNLVGTHVNVSKGGVSFARNSRVGAMHSALSDLSTALEVKYFGRRPYGYIYVQGGGKHLEFKLFDSTIDTAVLRRYIDISVALTDLIAGTEEITHTSLVAALERGYNKRNRKTKERETALSLAA